MPSYDPQPACGRNQSIDARIQSDLAAGRLDNAIARAPDAKRTLACSLL
jgi:hypothetical protein